MTAVTRGETAIGSTVLHGVINEIVRGFPVEPVLPCEGVGYEIGSTAIIKGTRNPEAARRFVDFALSADGQKVGLEVKEFAIPTNRGVPLPPQVPKLSEIKVIELRLREVRQLGRAAPAARALGKGNQRGAAMTSRPLLLWLAVGAAGLLCVPWYMLQDSVLSAGWIAHFAAKDNAPALWQIAGHGRDLAAARRAAPGGLRARPAAVARPARARQRAAGAGRAGLRLHAGAGLRDRRARLQLRRALERCSANSSPASSAWGWARRWS